MYSYSAANLKTAHPDELKDEQLHCVARQSLATWVAMPVSVLAERGPVCTSKIKAVSQAATLLLQREAVPAQRTF